MPCSATGLNDGQTVVIWEHVAQRLRELGSGLLDRLLPRLRHNNDLHEPFVVRHIGIALPELHMVTALSSCFDGRRCAPLLLSRCLQTLILLSAARGWCCGGGRVGYLHHQRGLRLAGTSPDQHRQAPFCPSNCPSGSALFQPDPPAAGSAPSYPSTSLNTRVEMQEHRGRGLSPPMIIMPTRHWTSATR